MATITQLLIFFILIINSIPIPSFSCPLHHKQALLHFKSTLLNTHPTSYYYNLYESWSPNSDCCSWNLVNCSKTRTRVITKLDLSAAIPSLDSRSSDILTPLFHIRSLKLLDISFNHLVGEIPGDGFGNLTQLVHLDMSWNRFNGSIPNQIFGLTNLRYLKMSWNSFEGNLGSKLGGSFWNLTSLRVLALDNNMLSGMILSPEVGKLQYLETLDLTTNAFNGKIPEEIGNLTKLREFYLAENRFIGGIPCSIANMKDLEVVDLSENLFSMQIPTAIGRLPNMTTLRLHNNQFMGPIPSSIRNLSKLEILWLQNNKLTGEIPIGLFKIRTLTRLFIGGNGNKLIWDNKAKVVPSGNLTEIFMPSCGISGQIPDWISSNTGLNHLDLSGNKLEGRFPYWLAQMDIRSIVLYNNKLSGSIPPRLFESTSLKTLQLSNNNFSGELPANIGNAKNMWILMLSRNNFSGKLPRSMSNLHNLRLLDLSRNKLSGDNFPDFTKKYSSGIPLSDPIPRLSYVDLSYNEFSGRIPTTFSTRIQVLCLGGNKFSGNLPWKLTTLVRLRHLDLHDNDITGYFQDVLPQIPDLQVLVLRNNFFEGFIPTTISNFTNLRILDLSGNKLTGSIPQEIANLTRMIESPVHMSTSDKIFDVFSNFVILEDDYDTIHVDIEDLIVNWKNYFQGLSSDSLGIYSFLDLSNNRLSGEIPALLGNLKGLKVLNVSHNNISGHIPVSLGNLKGIESLDLSHNKISGSIPQSLGKLGELTILDVSNNKLTGKIPRGGQMDTMNEVKYFANNNRLCGMQIKIKCTEDIPPSEEGREEEDDEKLSWIFWEGTWIGFPIGFFSSILIMGYSLNFLLLFKFW
ncbi:hypothetical protein L6452_23937 [Arctium lappa]|uniref:Uncharacterized protein n=2 Tax=Arctium lappa TaxID=4217 RepID=A0ACB9A9T9_ARCLA|nr:hypothetical protein L6452_23935 [Arctium lappa]KAI3706301.1 hypothetical protein L6452_23937 [Arctium lappa]